MKYTDCAWDETVAVLPAAYRNTTAWHVAVNGCMAGCKPEYMPLLIAMTKAMGNGEFRRTQESKHAWVPYSWLNGHCTNNGEGCYGVSGDWRCIKKQDADNAWWRICYGQGAVAT